MEKDVVCLFGFRMINRIVLAERVSRIVWQECNYMYLKLVLYFSVFKQMSEWNIKAHLHSLVYTNLF